MMDEILHILAAVMAATVLVRAVSVVYGTTPKMHKHPLIFLGFGYSYVTMGAGAIFAAVELITSHDLAGLPLWLMLGGSCGLIVFDRRMAICWTRTDCPADPER